MVEAGVDFSFDGVVRVIAGIDNLVQAAGRCNRSNEYKNWGRVYLVNLKNENLGMLKEIKAAQDSTLQTLSYWKKLEGSGLFDDEMINRFYQYLFRSSEIKKEMRYPKNNGHDIVYLTDLLANKNRKAAIYYASAI